MNPKLFTGLAVAAVSTLALAALVHASSDRWASGTPSGARLFPYFKSDVARTQQVTLKQGAQTITLERKGEAWDVKDRGGFPVQGAKVGNLLARLEEAQIVGAKTRNPEKFPVLELEDPAAKDAKSRWLSVADDKGKVIAELIVGKRSTEQFGAGKGGTYVRRPGENATWLVNSEIDVNPAVNQWADTTIFEAEIGKVAKVVAEQPGEPKLVVEHEAGKPANKDGYKLVDMPAGKKLKYDYALEDIVNAFARVEFEDVRKVGAAPAADAAAAVATTRFEADNGLAITVRVKGTGDARWATIEASATPVAAPAATAAAATPAAEAKPEAKPDAEAKADASKPDASKPDISKPEAGKPDAGKADASKPDAPADAKAKAEADAKAQADAAFAAAKVAADKINARTTGWEFKLPSWKLDQFFKKQADLLDAAG